MTESRERAMIRHLADDLDDAEPTNKGLVASARALLASPDTSAEVVVAALRFTRAHDSDAGCVIEEQSLFDVCRAHDSAQAQRKEGA